MRWFSLAFVGIVIGLALNASAATSIGTWLPKIAPNFTPWGQAKAAYHGRFDGFVCANAPPAPKASPTGFDYAMSRCPVLQGGTPTVFGSGEPQRGKAVYDAAHRIALSYSGCCAARSYVLAAGITPPPIAIRSADLSEVKTSRGIGLGMTMSDVVAAYGKAVPYLAGTGASAVPVLSYTTFGSDPVHSSEACGQYQTFAFRAKKVVAIEIYTGC